MNEKLYTIRLVILIHVASLEFTLRSSGNYNISEGLDDTTIDINMSLLALRYPTLLESDI